jgi:hypothetical protein
METSKNVIQNIKIIGIHNKNFLQEIKFILTAYITQLNEINILRNAVFSTMFMLLLLLLLLCLHIYHIMKKFLFIHKQFL